MANMTSCTFLHTFLILQNRFLIPGDDFLILGNNLLSVTSLSAPLPHKVNSQHDHTFDENIFIPPLFAPKAQNICKSCKLYVALDKNISEMNK